MKGILEGQSFTLSRNWPAPGKGSLFRASEAPDVQASEIDNKTLG